MQEYIKVGVGVMVMKDGKILLGKRIGNKHGAGEYALPGGKLEFGETLEECAVRETMEESGLTIANLRLLCTSDLLKYPPQHFVDVGFVADWKSGEPQTMEPDKLEGWAWYNLDELPSPLFACLDAYIESYKTGRKYFTYPKK
jgi:8-oxo-dGTP diphosphatase